MNLIVAIGFMYDYDQQKTNDRTTNTGKKN